MIVKPPDDHGADLATLRSLTLRPDVDDATRRQIDREILNIRAGLRGEAEAAYTMAFHYGHGRNWAVLHDLRLEHGGRVAQIDHLLINRLLDVYVCESKHFAEGVSINEHGEFTAFRSGRPHGVPSPLEQNRRHIEVLEDVFRAGAVPLPRRLGLPIRPRLRSLVLVSMRARVTRPRKPFAGLDDVIKNDQLKLRIDRDFAQARNPLSLARAIGPDTLRRFAEALAAQHKPIVFDWQARFGLPAAVPNGRMDPRARTPDGVRVDGGGGAEPEGRVCADCGVGVSAAVAKFCGGHAGRFGGRVYCMGCQGRYREG